MLGGSLTIFIGGTKQLRLGQSPFPSRITHSSNTHSTGRMAFSNWWYSSKEPVITETSPAEIITEKDQLPLESRLWEKYCSQLFGNRVFLATGVTSCVVIGLGDVLCQYISHLKREDRYKMTLPFHWDFDRTLRRSIWGGMYGLAQLVWFDSASTLLPTRWRNISIPTKVLLEQFVFLPLCLLFAKRGSNKDGDVTETVGCDILSSHWKIAKVGYSIYMFLRGHHGISAVVDSISQVPLCVYIGGMLTSCRDSLMPPIQVVASNFLMLVWNVSSTYRWEEAQAQKVSFCNIGKKD